VKSFGRLFGVSTTFALFIGGNVPMAAERHATLSSEAVVREFYEAVSRKDIAAARRYLGKDLKFYGLFETYNNSDEYVAALTGLLGVTERLDVKAIVAQGENAAVFFDLKTIAPVAGDTLVAEWHQVREGKIVRVRSAFDGRLFAPMFEAKPGHQSKSESDIKALNDVFAAGFVGRNPKLRASIWLDAGTLVPPTGGLFKGREEIEKDFETEVGAVTDKSAMEFSNYHFDFQGPDVAYVDVDLTIRNVKGPDGILRSQLPVGLFMVAVREHGRWGIRAERAHFR
jgi:ketosteroid isomerase-like protein